VISAALVLAVAASGFTVMRHDQSTGDEFDVSLVAASYTLPQDASGIVLNLTVRNGGPAMVDLTSLAVDQPGLIRANPNLTGTPYDATQPMAATTNAISPLPMPPQDIEVVTVPFYFDCTISTNPPAASSIRVTGVSARGGTRNEVLALPSDATPWDEGDTARAAVCAKPSPQSDLTVKYGGIGNTLAQLEPVRFDYTIALTAPPATNVTVTGIAQDNPGIAASADPGLPAVVLDGQTVRLNVTWRVMSCVIARSVPTGNGVEITAFVGQATQTWHASLGAQFTKDLDAEITTVCSGG
jgi:hypothetical protein